MESCQAAHREPFGASHPPRFDRHQGPKVGQPIVSLVNSPVNDRKSTGKWFLFTPKSVEWNGPLLRPRGFGADFRFHKKNNGRFRNTPWTVESISLRQVPSYQDSTCLDGTFVACLEMISSAAKIIMKKSYNHQSYHHPWNSKDHFKKCVFHQVDDFFEVGNFWSSKIGVLTLWIVSIDR